MMDRDQPKENPLHISWHDSMWIPILNSANVMDYFSEKTNPFYSRDCNNEFIKMQQNTRVEQLNNMQGIEYILLHAQEPILYIIRKEHRYSPTQVTPLANYHIIGGQVYQTPDVGSIINSRLLAAMSNLTSAFTELQSFSQYHPSRGYWWQFRNQTDQAEQQKKKEGKKAAQNKKEEKASLFQNQRVNALLEDLHAKFPYKFPTQPQTQAQASSQSGQPQSQSANQTSQQQSHQQQPQQQQPQTTTQPQQQSQQQQSQSQTPGQAQSQPAQTTPALSQSNQDAPKSASGDDIKVEEKVDIKVEIKQEPGTNPTTPQPPPSQKSTKPPPEKRQRTGP